jgi:hypothetical protein
MHADSNNNIWPDRMTLDEKLKRLGISKRHLQSYMRTFVQNPQQYLIKYEAEGWKAVKSKTGKFVPLNENSIGFHLLGKYSVATFSPDVTRYLCLDLDRTPGLMTTYAFILDWLESPLVFLSSESRGLHVYIFFDIGFCIKPEKLVSITSKELEIRKIPTGPGICEIFPSPNKFLRLPLGQGSMILDPRTLNPLCQDLKESIEFIRKNLRMFSFEELFPGLARKIGNG